MNTVLLRRREGVATLELNRPHRKNSLTVELVEEAIDAVAEVASSVQDRVLVITGAGDAFCSGMDLSAPLLPDELTFMRRVGQLCTMVHEIPKPTIARVNGPAMGFGANFALCCDFVLAGKSAVFGEMFADLGISVDGGGTWTLPRLVGTAKAKELVFFGERITGDQAAELGIANRVVADTELDELVDSWAGRLAEGPTIALSMMKKSINSAFETSFDRALEQEALAQAVAFRSQEAREAGRARAEKRRPDFRGATSENRDRARVRGA
ncbi:enoyl-CoA hydratase/isomerase family protein [Rhodococcus rhodochrous]|uniref:enoyl-CoA hydratase/isomerase family protein n=1 Tax=Rhodococcus rhodochrous TaxID=1829 RepID=UPI0006C85FE1|nr:enoyl-CoA hydratase-related protein [Rhodococcus rhodochrous]